MAKATAKTMAKKPAPKKKVAPKASAKPLQKPIAKPAAKVAAKPVAKVAQKSLAKSAAKRVAQAGNKPAAKAGSLKTPVSKPVTKSTQPEPKVTKPLSSKPAPSGKPSVASSKPALMTKKGKATAEMIEEVGVDVEDAAPAAKSQSVVSMLESDAATDEPAKADKVSKVKPVKIERGNLSDEKAKWAELSKKYGKDKAVTYKMSEKFTTMTPLQHKVLGWGFILTNENDRLEVLFESGIRMLISNYKT